MRRQLGFSVVTLVLICSVVSSCFAQDDASRERQLLEAARNGNGGDVQTLIKAGISVGVKDASGRTPLHLAAGAGHQATAQILLEHGAEVNAKDNEGHTPLDAALGNGHTGTAQFLQSKGAVKGAPVVHPVSVGAAAQTPRTFHPDAEYTTEEAFSKAIGEPAIMLNSPNVCLLAPKRREKAASVVFPYLVRAYDELYEIVGVHTKYRILVYAFPKGFPGVRGGTSGCVIKYTDENLVLENQAEWKEYHVPHVSGYIEEMAHNFVWATGAEFGWEMIGWSLSAKVSEIVAPNPIHQRDLAQTRQGQEQTYRRYAALGRTFPADLRGDQADRIHAYLLRKCELQYGPTFWRDFFKEVQKERPALFAPEAQGESAGLDLRYRITVQCFDRLAGLNFRKLLEDNEVSTTVAIQSLKPTIPGWNRKLQ